MKKPLVSFLPPTWTEIFRIHTLLPDVLVSYKHDIAYDLSVYPSGFADLCLLIRGMKPVCVILSNTNSSACHMGAYSVPHLFLVFFRYLSRRNQLQQDVVRLGFGTSLVPCGGFFLFPLVSVVGMPTKPANHGSFLIAACRLTNLVRSFRAAISSFSLIEYDTSAHVLIK